MTKFVNIIVPFYFNPSSSPPRPNLSNILQFRYKLTFLSNGRRLITDMHFFFELLFPSHHRDPIYFCSYSTLPTYTQTGTCRLSWKLINLPSITLITSSVHLNIKNTLKASIRVIHIVLRSFK